MASAISIVNKPPALLPSLLPFVLPVLSCPLSVSHVCVLALCDACFQAQRAGGEGEVAGLAAEAMLQVRREREGDREGENYSQAGMRWVWRERTRVCMLIAQVLFLFEY